MEEDQRLSRVTPHRGRPTSGGPTEQLLLVFQLTWGLQGFRKGDRISVAPERGQENSRPERNHRGLYGRACPSKARPRPSGAPRLSWAPRSGFCGVKAVAYGSCPGNPEATTHTPHTLQTSKKGLVSSNVLKLLLKNSNLVSAEPRERNVRSPLPGELMGSEWEGKSPCS